ncbi:unnamed protein product [Parnassius mnemosyne]|uniref:Endonuclease/exonuclease/phosphatase domain-containing protein n=1 Tax=Parnassius mnemosyne TaxID=213953 RepID=A0AAV1LHC0_9NEOP
MPQCDQLSSKSHRTRDIGPITRICQVNIERISQAKCEVVIKILLENDINVLLLQETHAREEQDPHKRGAIPGYNLAHAINHAQYRIATYVKDGIKHVAAETCLGDPDVFASAIMINNLTIVNVYKPTNSLWTTNLPAFPYPCLYAGDFNSYHTTWRYNKNDANGKHLVQWAENNNVHLVFNAKDSGSFRSARWKRDYNPDLTFTTCDINRTPLQTTRRILSDVPNSQHRPVLVEVGIKIPLTNSMPLPRWNLHKADWPKFSADMDAAIRWIPHCAENYKKFTKLIITTAKKSIARGYRKAYIPCCSEESEKLFDEYTRTGNHEIGDDLLKSRNRWLDTVESMVFKTSSRKAWSMLNGLAGKTGKNSRGDCKQNSGGVQS